LAWLWWIPIVLFALLPAACVIVDRGWRDGLLFFVDALGFVADLFGVVISIIAFFC